MADLIPAFPDGAFRRVLCVVAHPDDVEYGMSSAVAAWTARGIEVAYLLLTRGEAGMDASPPEQTAELRTAEQIAGSRAVGVTDVEFLSYPDGVLEYSVAMRRDIARVIRRRQPDAVTTGSRAWPRPTRCVTRVTGGSSPSCSTRAWRPGRRGGCWSAGRPSRRTVSR
jgi:hypothetical protein